MALHRLEPSVPGNGVSKLDHNGIKLTVKAHRGNSEVLV